MIRIGILSDTHITSINDDFKRILKNIFRDVDMIFHAGDMTSMVVYDYLSTWDLKAVRGNMDDFTLRTILPDKRIEEIEGIKIGIIHGRGGPDGIEELVLSEFQDVDAVVFGHSHVPLNIVKKGIHLFNPGSLKGRYSYPGSAGILELDGEVRFKHLSVHNPTYPQT
ncbi:MAG: YfcE family phosphodiesterase [Syntrophobacterales bacterium]|nr:YfcE family phosphodiesterase [Syntrophobacterales bacterium]